jgi:hypothetical protein
MSDIREGGSTWSSTVGVVSFLSQQANDVRIANPTPHPDLAGFWMGVVTVVPEILGHRGPSFPER